MKAQIKNKNHPLVEKMSALPKEDLDFLDDLFVRRRTLMNLLEIAKERNIGISLQSLDILHDGAEESARFFYILDVLGCAEGEEEGVSPQEEIHSLRVEKVRRNGKDSEFVRWCKYTKWCTEWCYHLDEDSPFTESWRAGFERCFEKFKEIRGIE